MTNPLLSDKIFLANKLENAQRVLSASSPYLEPAIDKMGVFIKDDGDLSVIGFPNMWFFVGAQFLSSCTHHELIICLDYAITQALSDGIKKASILKQNNDNNETLSALAVSLEINSTIINKYTSFSQAEWNTNIRKNIDQSYVEVFHADKIPVLPSSLWDPHDFSFERGLSSDTYMTNLLKLSNDMEKDWLEKTIKEKQPTIPTRDKESNDKEDDDEHVKQHNNDNEHKEQYADSTINEIDLLTSERQPLSPYSAVKKSLEEKDDSRHEDSGSALKQDEDDFIHLEDSISQAHNIIARSQVRQYSFQNMTEMDDDLVKLFSMSGGGESNEGISYQDKDDMEREIAKRVEEYSRQNPGLNDNRLGIYQKWSAHIVRKSKARWKKKLTNAINPLMGKAIQSGETDLSFSKRNPNQQPDQPLMMAMVTFDPNITIMVDASPSMLKHQSETIEEVSTLLQKILLKYSTPADIALVDNKVRYVFTTQTPNKRLKKAISRTYAGGSEGFGYTMGRIIKKGIKYKGNYPKPDLLIVITDCFFNDWPFPDKGKLPNKFGSVVIVSTEPWDKVKGYIPSWVKPGKNFFETI